MHGMHKMKIGMPKKKEKRRKNEEKINLLIDYFVLFPYIFTFGYICGFGKQKLIFSIQIGRAFNLIIHFFFF